MTKNNLIENILNKSKSKQTGSKNRSWFFISGFIEIKWSHYEYCYSALVC